jgi:acetyl esterase/lipase
MLDHGRTLLAVSLALLGGCSGPQLLNALTPDHGYVRTRDIAYSSNGQKLDVYEPVRARAAPVVVFFYGGSWKASSTLPKGDYKFVGQALAAAGFVTVIPDYRVYPAVRFPEFLDDCAAAVVWAHRHAAEYGGDPGKLVLAGHSAGAYNAAMLALDETYLGRAGGDRGWVRGMVGLAGPYDFLPLTDPELQTIFAPAPSPALTQPVTFADGRAPPMLLLAGADDTVVYASNTESLNRQLRDHGVPVREQIFAHMSHIHIIALMGSRVPGHRDFFRIIADFVDRATGRG